MVGRSVRVPPTASARPITVVPTSTGRLSWKPVASATTMPAGERHRDERDDEQRNVVGRPLEARPEHRPGAPSAGEG